MPLLEGDVDVLRDVVELHEGGVVVIHDRIKPTELSAIARLDEAGYVSYGAAPRFNQEIVVPTAKGRRRITRLDLKEVA